MNNKFWQEYTQSSVDIIRKAIFIGGLAVVYSFIPDFISLNEENRFAVITLRSISVIYLFICAILLKKDLVKLSKIKNYYIFIYSIFIVILSTALTIGFITQRLTTFYFFVIIELELFYAILTISRMKIFTFFVIFANFVYFVLVFISGEPISGTTISVLSSVLIIAPLAIFIQNQILDYHKKEYLKRQKLFIEINQREQAQIRLIEAKEIAEKANVSKSIFIASLSHEVRTPIHAIMNYSTMGVKKIDSLDKEKTKHYFSQISTSADGLLRLVEELLDFAKLKNSHTSYNSQYNNILTTIKKAVLELKVLSDKKNISVKLENKEIKNIIAFDESRIMQVVLNIVANSIKFSPDNSTIRIIVESGQNDFMLIKVIDEGIGIDKSELRFIFKDFTQGSRTRTMKKGTGLGLSISKKIVEGHGGKIWASNNKERGATFSFTLPKNIK